MSEIKQSLLSAEENAYVIDTIVSFFDLELSRMSDKELRTKVLHTFFQEYSTINYYSFFTPLSLQNITEEYAGNETQRDFIMNLVERVSIHLTNSEIQLGEKFANTLASAVTVNKPRASDYTLLNPELSESIVMDKGLCIQLFTANVWLGVLYLLLTNFHKSSMYLELMVKYNSEEPAVEK